MTSLFADRIRTELAARPRVSPQDIQPLPRILYLPRRGAVVEQAHAKFENFYEPEIDAGQPKIWTKEHSQLTCVFSRTVKVRWLWLNLFRGSHPAQLSVSVNDSQVYCGHFKGRRQLAVHLPQQLKTHRLVIEFRSTTFVPRHESQSSFDARALGVQLAEIRIAKHWWRKLTCLPLRIPRPPNDGSNHHASVSSRLVFGVGGLLRSDDRR